MVFHKQTGDLLGVRQRGRVERGALFLYLTQLSPVERTHFSPLRFVFIVFIYVYVSEYQVCVGACGSQKRS